MGYNKLNGVNVMNYDELIAGFKTAYIDGSVVSSAAYRPQFISNDSKSGKKVLSSIEEGLLSCDSFKISVAFITDGGFAALEISMNGPR